MGYATPVDLILSEQTLLIALDDEKGRDSTQYGGEAGLAAGLLLDLAALDLLRVGPDDKLKALDGPSPAHPQLREAHATIASSASARSAKGWVDRLPRELKPLRERLAQGLVERGVLSESRSKAFGLFPITRYPTADPGPERALRERLHDVLVTGREPTEPEALLIGLLEPLGLVGNAVEPGDRKAAKRRAKEIAEQGIAGTAVRDAVAGVQAAVVASVVLPAVVTGS
jgi:hypothetical protein